MTFGSILLLAVGLSMDAAAVSAAKGLTTPRLRPVHLLLVAGFFGGFQVLMPLLGWALGSRIGPLIQAWDHWLAFGLLVGIGGKMIWEAVHDDEDSKSTDAPAAPFGMRVMFVLAIATSIDSFAVGVTLPVLKAPLLVSLATIGVTTAVLSAVGLVAGHRFGAMLGKRLDLAGGVVLIGLGCKILLEHLLEA